MPVLMGDDAGEDAPHPPLVNHPAPPQEGESPRSPIARSKPNPCGSLVNASIARSRIPGCSLGRTGGEASGETNKEFQTTGEDGAVRVKVALLSPFRSMALPTRALPCLSAFNLKLSKL